MNKKFALLAIPFFAFAFAGCAHNAMRGSVAMKTSEDEAHVCLGDNEVKAGDKVSLFKNVCTAKGKATEGNGACEKRFLGEGEITQLLNQHYSVMKVAKGVTFDEGTIVEKQ